MNNNDILNNSNYNTIGVMKALAETEKLASKIYENLTSLNINPELLDVCDNYILAEIIEEARNLDMYISKFKNVSDYKFRQQDEKIKELEIENKVLQNNNIMLQKEKEELQWKVNDLLDEIKEQNIELGQLKCQLNIKNEVIKAKDEASNLVSIDLIEAIDKLDKAVNLVEDNAKALSLSYKLKTEPRVNMHGEDHPRYNKYIDNDSLISDYQSGMILKDLSKKYKISIPGVRNRLMDLGVYKQVYKK